MKAIIAILLVSSTAYAHNMNGGSGARHCNHEPLPSPEPTMESLQPKLSSNNIEILRGNTVSPGNTARFLTEYEKFPAPLRAEMVSRGAKIRLMEGTGVGIDPSLTATTTTEGTRQWVNVPGSGGEIAGGRNTPTRIAINHLYDNHGSSNLVLHEHAHTLDSIYGSQAVSKSDVWKNLMASTPKTTEFTRTICGQYCLDREEERFAELFSYYLACPASREHLEQELPAVADFFSKMSNVKAIVDGKDPRGTPAEIAARAPATAPAAAPAAQEACETQELKNATTALQPLTAVVPYVQKIVDKSAPAAVYRGSSTSAAGMK